MYLKRNKKNNVYPCKPQFYYIKGALKGSKLYRHVFVCIAHTYFENLYCSDITGKYWFSPRKSLKYCIN